MSGQEQENMDMVIDMALNKAKEAIHMAEETLQTDDSATGKQMENEAMTDEEMGSEEDAGRKNGKDPIVIVAKIDTQDGIGDDEEEKGMSDTERDKGVYVSVDYDISGTKRIFLGLVLIILAVYMILKNLKLVPSVPVLPAIVALICLYVTFQGIRKKSFFMTIFPLAVIGCVFDKQLKIEEITPWILLGSALLLSGGLSLLFSKKIKEKKKFEHVFGSHTGKVKNLQGFEESAQKTADGNDVIQIAGDVIRIENNFHSSTRYVDSKSFSSVSVENNMGSCDVYFSDEVPLEEQPQIDVENNMGYTRLYIPAGWNLVIRQENSMGSVKLHGDYCHDEEAPKVQLQIENNMGRVEVFLE